MTYPSFHTSSIADAGDLRTGPVTCSACGCRLRYAADGSESWFHFAPMAGRDARGCRVDCADAAHDMKGRARSVAAA
jgi:hypothetical protein